MRKSLLLLYFILASAKTFGSQTVITPPSSVQGINATSQQKESVVCVHAFLRSYKSLKPISHSLEKDGYEVFIWNYETRKFTLQKHAEHLVRLLKKIAEMKPGVPINFVTHSVGGVVVRAALSREDCPKEAKQGKAILMAPPNAGSTLARRYRCLPIVQAVFGDNLGRQLLTYSPQKMLNTGKMPDEVEVLILKGNKSSKFLPFRMEGENDGKVRSAETCLTTPHLEYTIDSNHTYIVSNKKSIYLVKKFLKEGYSIQDIQKKPEVIEKAILRNKESRLITKQRNDIYIIHYFRSSIWGFPKARREPLKK
ncbi:esterase/lipase family protein [Chlamydiifrater phoenicopteri]|uniref:esterase/lipase family protein n=1 Tax=Chlamydiifrater phoenicopteri TaxID=2681469 RepID=UPI001BCFD849|nr:alpha/beta hydrolase [Chlamydiifrater phoenicopteri]